jgi:hypothetical protein
LKKWGKKIDKLNANLVGALTEEAKKEAYLARLDELIPICQGQHEHMKFNREKGGHIIEEGI